MFQSCGHLHVEASSQNILHGIVHDVHHKTHQCDDKRKPYIGLILVGPVEAVARHPRGNKSNIQTQQIQEDEVYVLHPALDIFLIHTTPRII